MNDEQIDNFLRQWELLITSSVLYGSRQFNIALKESIKEVLRLLNESASIELTYSLATNLVSEIPISITMQRFLERINDRTTRFVFREYAKILPESITQGVGFGSEAYQRQVMDYINSQGAQHVKEITQTTRKLVNKAFLDGIAEQDSIKQISKRIERYTLGGLDGRINRRARSLLIARTESLMMAEYSKELQIEAFPDVRYDKRWYHARGVKNPRDTHVSLSGTTIPKSERFNVNGKFMKYPGDPVGGAENNCNCSCSCIYIPIL